MCSHRGYIARPECISTLKMQITGYKVCAAMGQSHHRRCGSVITGEYNVDRVSGGICLCTKAVFVVQPLP